MTVDSATLLVVVLTSFTSAIAGWFVYRGVRVSNERLGAPLILCALCLYLYGYMGYDSYVTFSYALPQWCFVAGQITVLIALGAALIGWFTATGRTRYARAAVTDISTQALERLWLAGIVQLCIGTIGTLYFKLAHENRLADTNGYVAAAFQAGFPGAVLATSALTLLSYRGGRGRVSMLTRRLITGVLLATYIVPHLLTFRRGPVFAFSICIVYSAAFFAKQIHVSRVLAGLGIAGGAMLLLLPIRSLTDQNANTISYADGFSLLQQGLTDLEVVKAAGAKSRTFDDNEYIYHCASIGTNMLLGGYQYGTGYLYLAAHWIPRAWWPNKPETGEAMFMSVRKRIVEAFGWHMSDVAAAGEVADTFEEFGIFYPLFWWGLFHWLGRLFTRAWSGGDYKSAVRYVCLLATSHWFVTQDFRAAFVPACIYLLCLEVACRFAGVNRRARRHTTPISFLPPLCTPLQKV